MNDSWSRYACFGSALETGEFERTQMVCTKTLYNYIDLGLLKVRNSNLHLKLRRNTKPARVRKNKKNIWKIIEERPDSISTRKEFGHWEIETVIGEKSASDWVLLTLLERHEYAVAKEALFRKNESHHSGDTEPFCFGLTNIPYEALGLSRPCHYCGAKQPLQILC